MESEEVGAVGRKGVLVSSGDVLKVSGSGRDIGGTSDQFYYVYVPWCIMLLSTYLPAETNRTEPPRATKKMDAHANIG
jgi:hypothetical protein